MSPVPFHLALLPLTGCLKVTDCGAERWEAGQRPEPRAPGNLSRKAFLFFSALPLCFFFFFLKFKNILFKMKFPVKLYVAFYLKM